MKLCGKCGLDRTKSETISWDAEDCKLYGNLDAEDKPVVTRLSGSDFKNGTCSGCGYQTLGTATYLTRQISVVLNPTSELDAGVKTSTIQEALQVASKTSSEDLVSVPRKLVSAINLALCRAEAELAGLANLAKQTYEEPHGGVSDGPDVGASEAVSALQRIFLQRHESWGSTTPSGFRTLQAIKQANELTLHWNTHGVLPEDAPVPPPVFSEKMLQSKKHIMLKGYSDATEEERTKLHRDYYGLLVETLGERALRKVLPASRDRLIKNLVEDLHLNNIPLHLWDQQHARVWHLINLAGGPSKLEPIIGPGGWSLSDSVCTLKEAARRWAEEKEEKS